jgi:hypothetical protein
MSTHAEIIDQVAKNLLDQAEEDPQDVEPPPDEERQRRTLEGIAARNGMKVNAPARPDLKPGESITTVPERWCEKCEQPRGGRKCHVCSSICVQRVEIEDAEEYERETLVSERDPGESFFGRRRQSQAEDEEQQESEEQYERRVGARAAARAPAPRHQRTPAARGRNYQMPQPRSNQRSRLVNRGGEVVHMSGRSNAQRRVGTAEEALKPLDQQLHQ